MAPPFLKVEKVEKVEKKLKYFLIYKLNVLITSKQSNQSLKPIMYAEMNTELNQQLSLYIPHVFPNFTQEYIKDVFEFMEFGNVERVDLVSKMDKNGSPYNSAYIHFSEWFTTPVAENFKARVLDPEREARIIHDDPWYWIVLENTAKKHVPGTRKVCLDLSENVLPIACGLPGPVIKTSTPGVFQVILTEKEQKDIDSILKKFSEKEKHLKGTEENSEDIIKRLQVEIEELRNVNAMHLAHSEECHKKISSMTLENNILIQNLIDAEIYIDETNKRMKYATQCLEKSEEEIIDLELAYQNELVQI